MLLVDSRIGSKDLAPQLNKMGLPVTLTMLDSADIAFVGHGPNEKEVEIGIELKKLPDLLSSLRSGRLAGEQLPKMVGPNGQYDYGWLFIEGDWAIDKSGQVCQRKGTQMRPLPGSMTGAELEKQILTLELCGGLHVRYTVDRAATLAGLGSLYRWWTDKSFSAHRSHLAVHTPHSFLPISDFRAAVQRFPGIGQKASLAVERYFQGSLRRACNAPVSEWAEITTLDRKNHPRRLGMAVATKIVAFVRGVI